MGGVPERKIHPYPGRLIIIASANGRILYEREPFVGRISDARYAGRGGKSPAEKLPPMRSGEPASQECCLHSEQVLDVSDDER